MKICTKCGQKKDFNEFHKDKNKPITNKSKVTCLPFYMVKEGIDTGDIGEIPTNMVKQILKRVENIPPIALKAIKNLR